MSDVADKNPRNTLTDVRDAIARERTLDLRLPVRAETPLIWAVGEGYHDIAVLLIEAGADVNAKNANGNTALLRAACEGHAELASVLIRVGADLDAQNHEGYTALVLARRRGNTEIVESLLAAGADRSLIAKNGAFFDVPGISAKRSHQAARDATLEREILDMILRCRDGRAEGRSLEKHINLNAGDRFLSTEALRQSYLRHTGSLNPYAPNYISLEDDMELGIVFSGAPAIARAVSSLLTRSLEDARHDRGGYIPSEVVQRVQREIISPYGVAHLWGVTGHRFVLTRRIDRDRSELLATILVGRSKDTIFFFTGRYNNLRHSTMADVVDLEQPNQDDHSQKWFDRFRFPRVEHFKPKGYHHIANFVVSKEMRGAKLSRLLLDTIVQKYSREHLIRHDRGVEHSQHLLCGSGFWQIGDPPWLPKMEKLGFFLRWGAESFFIDHPWAPLPAVSDPATGSAVSNLSYNESSGIIQRYMHGSPRADTPSHLRDRVPEVLRLARDPRAKLQYFQAMFNFI